MRTSLIKFITVFSSRFIKLKRTSKFFIITLFIVGYKMRTSFIKFITAFSSFYKPRIYKPRTFAIYIIALFIVGCQTPEVVHPHENPVDCSSGCNRLVELKCEEMLKQLDSETGTCAQACEQILKSGGKLNLACWVKTAKTCADIDGICAQQ